LICLKIPYKEALLIMSCAEITGIIVETMYGSLPEEKF
jgi:hypothetical protein